MSKNEFITVYLLCSTTRVIFLFDRGMCKYDLFLLTFVCRDGYRRDITVMKATDVVRTLLYFRAFQDLFFQIASPSETTRTENKTTNLKRQFKVFTSPDVELRIVAAHGNEIITSNCKQASANHWCPEDHAKQVFINLTRTLCSWELQ